MHLRARRTMVLAMLVACIGGHGAARADAPACPKPGDPIAIQSVSLSVDPIRTGRPVSGTVLATCNVASVTAQVGSYRISVPKVAPGVFQTTVDVPRFILPGRFTLVITAIRTDGASVQTSMPIRIRW